MQNTEEATPERLAKGDVTEVYVQEHKNQPPEKRLRSSGALYALRRAGTITDAHVAAAEHWARDYETGVLGARDPEEGKKGGLPDPHVIMLSRAAAVRRCEYVRQCLGKQSEAFLYCLLINHMSISQIAEQRTRDRRQISGIIELLLEQLYNLYTNMPGIKWFYK